MAADGVEGTRSEAMRVFAEGTGAERIADIAGSREGSLFAARWRFERARIATANLRDGVLICRTVGTSAVARSRRDSTVRRRPGIGSISYVCPDTPTVWSVEGPCESCHVYLRRERLQEFAREHLDDRHLPMIEDLFAAEDPWLKGYFQMLLSEFETAAAHCVDTLFVTQAEHLLIHHLLQWHSQLPRRMDARPTKRTAHPLCSVVLHRVEDYIDENLPRDIALADLATVACMSSGHFLRAFRASSGTTPYQFVLMRRLLRASHLLRTSDMPVARIAKECGFKTASHLSSTFHATFGTSPSRHRMNA